MYLYEVFHGTSVVLIVSRFRDRRFYARRNRRANIHISNNIMQWQYAYMVRSPFSRLIRHGISSCCARWCRVRKKKRSPVNVQTRVTREGATRPIVFQFRDRSSQQLPSSSFIHRSSVFTLIKCVFVISEIHQFLNVEQSIVNM